MIADKIQDYATTILAKTLGTKRKNVDQKSKCPPLPPKSILLMSVTWTKSCSKCPESRQTALTWGEGGFTKIFQLN